MIPFESSGCVLAIMSGKVWREGKLWMSGSVKEKKNIYLRLTSETHPDYIKVVLEFRSELNPKATVMIN